MTAEDAASPALHSCRLDIGHPEIDGHDAQGHEAHVEVGGEHQHEGEDGAGEERQNLDEEIVHRVAQAHDASVDTRLQLSRLVALTAEEGHAERQDAVYYFQRQVAAHQDAHPLAVVALEERHHRSHQLLAQQDDADDGKYLYGG